MNEQSREPKRSVEAAFTARLMRNNYILMGPKLFAALPPWVHALEWEKGAPDADDISACGAVIGATCKGGILPNDATMEFVVLHNAINPVYSAFVMWAPLRVEPFKGHMPLWLQFKTP